ncbi:MAG: glycosyltransferase family 9 protein [bacterium]|nr:glycosyltransferase family 9 protein [bacterium]
MEKVLIIRYGGLGDIITTLPVIQSLKNNRYLVIIASNNRYKKLCLKHMNIDGFISVDSTFLLPLFSGEKETNLINFLKQFDIIISYTDEKEVFSKTLKDIFKGRIFFHPVTPEKIKQHIIKYLLEPIKNLNITISELPLLKVNPLSEKEFFIIHPGSGSPYKNWGKDKFLEVYKKLSINIRGLILLGYAEKEQREFWYNNIPSSNIVESENIEKVLSYVEKTSFYIGNDSGISHLFSAADIPSVVIFGPTSPYIWSPSGKNVRIIYSNIACSPCIPAKRKLCNDKICLKSISVEDVLNELEMLWKKP